MGIKGYIKKHGWLTECSILEGNRFMTVDIRFTNSEKTDDETQFVIRSYDVNELANLFSDFCAENGLNKNSVTGCVIVAAAATKEELE